MKRIRLIDMLYFSTASYLRPLPSPTQLYRSVRCVRPEWENMRRTVWVRLNKAERTGEKHAKPTLPQLLNLSLRECKMLFFSRRTVFLILIKGRAVPEMCGTRDRLENPPV